MKTRYYIETDGRIYLVPRDGKLDLPILEEIPFQIETLATLANPAGTVFCAPKLDKHPEEWLSKDVVSHHPDVAVGVRDAVHATMPRVVAEGICIQEGRVLLVKGSRGLTKDRWTLPGGFLRFGEDPEVGLLREIQEELGVGATIEAPLGSRSKLGQHSKLHWILFFYRVQLHGDPRPDPDEIADVRLFSPREAVEKLADNVMRDVIQSLC